MPTSNIALFEAAYGAYVERGDLDVFYRALDPDVEFCIDGSIAPPVGSETMLAELLVRRGPGDNWRPAASAEVHYVSEE